MILYGEIQRVETLTMTDKQSGAKSPLLQLIIMDKTKPSAFRSSTTFIYYMSPDRLAEKLGKGDLTDTPVTVAVKEMKGQNAFISIKGEIVQGHHAGDALMRMHHEAEAAQAAVSQAPAAADKGKSK